MLTKVVDTINEYDMLKSGDVVLVALSGGPDSVCLMHMLYDLKEKLGINLYAAHVNHCLRGTNSDEDEEYVKELCKELGVKLFVKRVDIIKITQEKSISSEMAGREARYDFFEELVDKLNINKVALAHNANDQAETILMRFMRGTGLKGLKGIIPIRDKVYIRPIIKLSRKEVEAYCECKALNPRIDESNLERIYSRNKIRLDLIPYMKENFNEDIINTLNRFSETITVDENYLEKIAYKNFLNYCNNEKNKVIINKEAFSLDEAILTRVIRLAIEDVVGNLNDFDKNNVYDLMNLQKNRTGRRIHMPKGIVAYNNYGEIHILKDSLLSVNLFNKNEKAYSLQVDKTNIIKEMGIKVLLEIIDNNGEHHNNKPYDKKKLIKCFNYDIINDDIILRYRKNGDKFSPLGMRGSKKLKDFFMDLKVPKDKRDNIPLICFDNEIAWIIGFRISEKYKINHNTKQILKIIIESEDSFNE